MSGTHRKEFNWKEIAAVLRMPSCQKCATFWQEVKRSREKNMPTKRPPSGTQEDQRSSKDLR
jgi:hypothetical protein